MGGWAGSRPPTILQLSGKVAEVWAADVQVGLLYEWSLTQGDGDWCGEADKYRFTADVGEVEVRFFYQVTRTGDQFELRGEGRIDGEYRADGETHRAPIKLRGTALAVM